MFDDGLSKGCVGGIRETIRCRSLCADDYLVNSVCVMLTHQPHKFLPSVRLLDEPRIRERELETHCPGEQRPGVSCQLSRDDRAAAEVREDPLRGLLGHPDYIRPDGRVVALQSVSEGARQRLQPLRRTPGVLERRSAVVR